MPDVTPYYKPEGPSFTGSASAAITGGRFVTQTGAPQTNGRPTVANGNTAPIGVAGRDAAVGGNVTIFGPGNVIDVEAGAAIGTPGRVDVAADGRVVPAAAGVRGGTAMGTAAAAGDLVKVLIHL